jgi:tetratricopeptide (TPR) repeat protein
MRKTRSVSPQTVGCIALAVVVFLVFGQVRSHPFTNLDDPGYVLDNPNVKAGLTKEGLAWAFTTMHMGNWHPLTWISHMLDVETFGLWPGGPHLVNAFFHGLSSLALFWVLFRMTSNIPRSWVVASLFAVHPLHVESVAWVAERKDVLSTFFWMATMWAYWRYARSPGIGRYFTVAAFFALGLLSKPMLVTLPFVLLVLDYWPLQRFQPGPGDAGNGRSETWKRLVMEKVPLLGMAAASSIVTFIAQRKGEAVAAVADLPVTVRVMNAAISYVNYIFKTVWPASLSIFYPYPSSIPTWEVTGSAIVLVAVSFLVLRGAKKRPYFLAGWFWYIGTLVPVIGIVQVGGQANADRYTYVPLIGIFIMAAWGISETTATWKDRRIGLGVACGLMLLSAMTASWYQVRIWANNVTLFRHALEVTSSNWVSQTNLGTALLDEGKQEEAIPHFKEVLRTEPRFSPAGKFAHYNLGLAHLRLGNLARAVDHFQYALWIDPDYVKARYNLALAFTQMGKIDDAIAQYRFVVQKKRDIPPEVFNNFGVMLLRHGETGEAIEQFRQLLELQPNNTVARRNLEAALPKKNLPR